MLIENLVALEFYGSSVLLSVVLNFATEEYFIYCTVDCVIKH